MRKHLLYRFKDLWIYFLIIFVICLSFSFLVFAGEPVKKGHNRLELMDVFHLEYASDIRISPGGNQVVYCRNFFDIMTDQQRSNLWIINFDGSKHRPLTSGNHNYTSPRWCPDGKKLLYVSNKDGSSQIYLRWMDTGQTAKLTNLLKPPANLTWSPDGKYIAFSMFVKEPAKPFVNLPAPPQGAKWAKPARVIRKIYYRYDGAGYLEEGYHHLFVLPVEGGTPRQVTGGHFHLKGGFTWTLDGKSLIFSANHGDKWEQEPRNSDIYEVLLADGSIKPMTDRFGPDTGPVISPDGKHIAYLGFDDHFKSFQIHRLYVMNRDGSGKRLIMGNLDRDVILPCWDKDGKGLFFQYDDQGNTKIGYVTLAGRLQTIAENVGGLHLGRPYNFGMFTVSKNNRFAFTHTGPHHPADVAVGHMNSAKSRRITYLNADLLNHKELPEVEEFWFQSSYDNRKIQGWLMTPPGFSASKKYPLVLEIHGGPSLNYGGRFTMECQLYAAAGYVVVYINPRGSSSYGEEFSNLIHQKYPGHDYDDLMSGVDAVIKRGYVDTNNLFVTGGSGGGVLTAWIVGHTSRFRAAVVAKPVINFYSFALTSDDYLEISKYFFPGFPWDNTEHYMRHSPINYVGNVKTPTMLLTGEADYRAPISETEQFYQALKLLKIDTVMVRLPEVTHSISARPGNMMAKVAHILKWFDMHRGHEDKK